MKVEHREVTVTLDDHEARLLRILLGQFNIETCRELYEGAEEVWSRIGINDANDLDRATDKLWEPLSELFPEYAE